MYGLFNRQGAYKQKLVNEKNQKPKLGLSKIFYGIKNKIKKKNKSK